MRNLREDYYSQLLQLSRDRAREALMPYATGPTSWGKTIAQHLAPGRGRPLSDDERRVLLTLAQELIDLSREDRATMVRAINTMVQSLITRGMQLPGFRDEIAPLPEAVEKARKETYNGSFGATIEEREMKGREEMKRKIRSLLRENEEGITFEKQPVGLGDYRRAYKGMEGMPSSLSSPIMAGRPIGARIAELPSESLRASVEGLILGILDVIDGAIEERGIGGAEVAAKGITAGLKSRGLTMEIPAVPEPETLKNGHSRRGQRLGESEIRREIRRALREVEKKEGGKEVGKEGEKNSKLSPDELTAIRTLLQKLDRTGQVSSQKWDELIEMISMMLDLAAENSESALDRLIVILKNTPVGKQAVRAHDRLVDRGKVPGEGEGR